MGALMASPALISNGEFNQHGTDLTCCKLRCRPFYLGFSGSFHTNLTYYIITAIEA